jgi:hypothetical protein
MADSEQVSQHQMAICRACRGFGVDTPITPPLTGDEGGEAHLSEYSLHFKMALVPPGDGRGRLATLALVGFGHRGLAVWPSTLGFENRGIPARMASPASQGIRLTSTCPGSVDGYGYPTNSYATCSASKHLRRWFKPLAYLLSFCLR